MNPSNVDTKAVIAVLVIIASFIIIGVYAFSNRSPDGYVVAIVSGSISAILGFYFGHANGSMTALSQSTIALANRTNPGEAVRKPDPYVPNP